MEYTKGEWKVCAKRGYLHEPVVSIAIQTPKGLMIISANGIPAKGEMFANANLIASAPDLYEACLSALGAMLTLDNNKEWVKEIAGVVKKALAKAEGKDEGGKG